MVTRTEVIKSYYPKAVRGKVDKRIALENVLGSYSLEPKQRQNNSMNLEVDASLYKWPYWFQGLLYEALQKLYRLYDSGELDSHDKW